MPTYNEETDEMLCEDIMSKEAFIKIKDRMMIDDRTKIVFYANYMCQAIDQVGDMKIFPRSTIKTYRDLPDEPYFMFAFIDPADEGKDYFAMPIFRVYKSLDRVYLIDAIFDQSNLSIQEIQVKLKCKQHDLRNMVIETNSAGAYFVRRLKEQLPQVEIFGQWSRVTKIDRMLNISGIVKYALYVPEEPNITVQTFMEQVYAILKTSKDKDDAPDALCGAIAFLESHYYMFKIE
jgi:predicted phage terminase large subunit-like protein